MEAAQRITAGVQRNAIGEGGAAAQNQGQAQTVERDLAGLQF